MGLKSVDVPSTYFNMTVKMLPYTTGENAWPSSKPLLKASEEYTSIFIFIFTRINWVILRRFRGQLILAKFLKDMLTAKKVECLQEVNESSI